MAKKKRILGLKAAASRRINRDGAVLALSVRQPHADQIIAGEKIEEYRPGPCNVRGRVYIYASKTVDFESCERLGYQPENVPTGVLIGTVEVVGCRKTRRGYAWELARPIPFDVPREPLRKPQPAWFRPFETYGADETVIQREPFTIFSWGYEGWGNSIEELIRSVDAVERSWGFKPPMFVDVRIRRGVRAKGFTERVFEDRMGPNRYRWMKGLGNQSILDGGGPIKIRSPKDAADLLNLAIEQIDDNRRVIFFCHCPELKEGRSVLCHRWVVGSLLLKAAERAAIPIEVVEWPGDLPSELTLTVTNETLAKVRRGGKAISLGDISRLPRFAGLAYGSVVCLQARTENLWIITGPAFYRSGDWQLPILERFESDDDSIWDMAEGFRTRHGREYRYSYNAE